MTPEQSVSLIADTVDHVVVLASVMVVPGLIVGLVVSIFQAVTQIQEQTLSFLPKFIITLLMLTFAGNWMIARITTMFQQIFINIPGMIG
ncbi:MAG: flagellar biosynthesis protein FliQ [Aeromonas sp.]